MGCTFLSRGDSWPRDARAEHDDSQDTFQHVVSLLNLPRPPAEAATRDTWTGCKVNTSGQPGRQSLDLM
jgi:hypothetical protein